MEGWNFEHASYDGMQTTPAGTAGDHTESRGLNHAVLSLSGHADGVFGAGPASAAAQAANVLLLMTNETHADAAITEFSGATVKKILDAPGALTGATFKDAPGPYDLVVVISVYNTIDAGNLAVLQNVINQRWANAHGLFINGCCNAPNGNVDKLASLKGATTGQGITVGSYAGGALAFPLNTALPGSSDFADLNPLRGGWVNYLNNVPFQNTLYLPAGTAVPNPPPTGSTPTTAFGALFPQTQVNGGRGACLFAVVRRHGVRSRQRLQRQPGQGGARI